MSCFSHQGFLGGGGGGGGSWYFVHGCELCNEGGEGKNRPNKRGGLPKNAREKSKITIAST